MSDQNNNSNESLIKKFKALPQVKQLFVIGMLLCLLIGIVFLFMGNTSYFFYSSVGVVVLYVLFRASRSV